MPDDVKYTLSPRIICPSAVWTDISSTTLPTSFQCLYDLDCAPKFINTPYAMQCKAGQCVSAKQVPRNPSLYDTASETVLDPIYIPICPVRSIFQGDDCSTVPFLEDFSTVSAGTTIKISSSGKPTPQPGDALAFKWNYSGKSTNVIKIVLKIGDTTYPLVPIVRAIARRAIAIWPTLPAVISDPGPISISLTYISSDSPDVVPVYQLPINAVYSPANIDIVAGCQDIEAQDVCKNSGSCSMATGLCVCQSGFAGVDCQDLVCSTNSDRPLECHGPGVDTTALGVWTQCQATCPCLLGWSGPFCRQRVMFITLTFIKDAPALDGTTLSRFKSDGTGYSKTPGVVDPTFISQGIQSQIIDKLKVSFPNNPLAVSQIRYKYFRLDATPFITPKHIIRDASNLFESYMFAALQVDNIPQQETNMTIQILSNPATSNNQTNINDLYSRWGDLAGSDPNGDTLSTDDTSNELGAIQPISEQPFDFLCDSQTCTNTDSPFLDTEEPETQDSKKSVSNSTLIIALVVSIAAAVILFIVLIVSIMCCRSRQVLCFAPPKSKAQQTSSSEHEFKSTQRSQLSADAPRATTGVSSMLPLGVELSSSAPGHSATGPSNHTVVVDDTLPPEWSAYQDSKQQIFYINNSTMKSQWSHPVTGEGGKKDDLGW